MYIFLKHIRDTYHIEYLNISAIPFDGAKSHEIVDWIKLHISTSNSLIHLDISCWNLNSQKLELIAQGLKESKSLKAVHLSGNTILPNDLLKLMKFLEGEELNLFDNTIVSFYMLLYYSHLSTLVQNLK